MRRVVLAVIVMVVLLGPGYARAAPPDSCSGLSTTDDRSTDGEDFLVGTNDRDVAALGDGADQYAGDGGADVLCGNDGVDVLFGEAGGDKLSGNGGGDTLVGLGGDDTLNGGSGGDQLDGGAGDDVLKAGPDGALDTLTDGLGTDTIIGDNDDLWVRCSDGEPDNHDDFFGQIVNDPTC